MKILFAASEVTPIAKTGGLADVIGALPISLRREFDLDARVVMPAYGSVDLKELGAVAIWQSEMEFGKAKVRVEIFETRLPQSDVPLYLVHFNPGLAAELLYPVDERVEQDRFALFSLVVLKWLEESRWQPAVVHGHDWMMGVLLQQIHYQELPYKTVLTIHNGKYQGEVDRKWFEALEIGGLPDGEMVNQLALGVMAADYITTVSPTYAKEIQQPDLGFGLEGLYRRRSRHLKGIVNGLDLVRFSTQHNPLVAPGYNRRTVGPAKEQHKHMLQVQQGLPTKNDLPLYGMVSRASSQKGFYVLADVLESSPFLETAQLIILAGRGTVEVEKRLEKLAKKYPQHLRVILGFDDDLSHSIYAASDFFVMPSLREPCGLTQLIAMRYGAVPIVHKTGGLADTVVDIRDRDEGVGIVFSDYAAQGLSNALGRSMGLYRDRDRYRQVQRVGMGRDFGWKRAAGEYRLIYKQILG